MFSKLIQPDSHLNIEGVGLGLFITKNITNQLGGVIDVESEIGKYSKFVVTLPLDSDLNQAMRKR